MLYTEIQLKWYHPEYHIGMVDPRQVWLLEGEPIQLKPTVYRGNLIYRLPKTRKRISYRTLKQGLVKTALVIKQPLEHLPF